MSAQARRSAKSVLFEYCQKRKIGPPYFETWAATNGYQAKVMIDGYPYPTSAVFSKKKEAEHDAAKACLASLGIFEDGTEGVNEYDPERGTEGYHKPPNSSFGTPPNGHSNFATPSPRSFNQPRSGGSSGGSVKMPKSVLHEFCQSQKLSLPQYETEASYDGNTLMGFHCVLVVRDEYFTTDRLHTSKRDAEHAAARKALNVFGYYTRSPLYSGSTPTPPRPASGTPSFQTPETSYKNLLQEHLQQRNIETPDYETQLTDGGYFSKVTIEGKVFKAKDCCQTKKLAEQAAAKAGLIAMGVKDPEAVARKLLGRKSRGQYRSPGVSPYQQSLPEMTDQLNQTWVHSHKQSGFDLDDYDDIDGEFVDFQKAGPIQLKRSHNESVEHEDFLGESSQRPHKLRRVGEGPENNSRPSPDKRPRRRGEYEIEDAHLGNLTVGEAWPERRNIVIVGSEETSIPLVCQGDLERCALEDMSSGTLVDIVPGHRLVGLEGFYVVRSGQIVLRADKCQAVVMPEEPDKVLISCGVVVLHCIPRRDGDEISCDVNVLLKRYLCSQAFINVVRGLAQYFRSRVTGRPMILNKELIVAHIQDWMLEEVMAISSFSETALENVFQHTMKFDKRWVRFLKDDQLSKELREVQEAANQELFRRANSGEDQNQDRFRPWRLPKGNFYHRILTTGVFIESPAEAAMRELKEETGIKLKLSDIHSSPYVELLQSDNLNPHKGDIARYYLCGIITESEREVEETKEKQPAEEPTAENPDAVSTAMESTATGESLTSTPMDSSAGTYPTGTDATVADTTSTNTVAYFNNPDTLSTNTGAGLTSAGAYSSNIGAYSTNSGTGSTNAGAYSATTDTGLTNAGAFSTNTGAYSAGTSSYSAYPSAYSSPYGTNSAYQDTNTPSYGTDSGYQGTKPYSINTDKPFLGTNDLPFNADKVQKDADASAFSADTVQKGTDETSISMDTAEAKDSTTPGPADTLDEKQTREESNVIRSPFVAGAVHEECKWFDIEEAKEISSVFHEIYLSREFQKLLAKLKGIVSTM